MTKVKHGWLSRSSQCVSSRLASCWCISALLHHSWREHKENSSLVTKGILNRYLDTQSQTHNHACTVSSSRAPKHTDFWAWIELPDGWGWKTVCWCHQSKYRHFLCSTSWKHTSAGPALILIWLPSRWHKFPVFPVEPGVTHSPLCHSLSAMSSETSPTQQVLANTSVAAV